MLKINQGLVQCSVFPNVILELNNKYVTGSKLILSIILKNRRKTT